MFFTESTYDDTKKDIIRLVWFQFLSLNICRQVNWPGPGGPAAAALRHPRASAGLFAVPPRSCRGIVGEHKPTLTLSRRSASSASWISLLSSCSLQSSDEGQIRICPTSTKATLPDAFGGWQGSVHRWRREREPAHTCTSRHWWCQTYQKVLELPS